MEPDEILVAPDTLSSLRPEEVIRYLEELAEKGELDIPKMNPIPIFVAGLVGGAIGGKVLKGTLGLVLGGGLAFWAYKELTRPSPIFKPPPKKPSKSPGRPAGMPPMTEMSKRPRPVGDIWM